MAAVKPRLSFGFFVSLLREISKIKPRTTRSCHRPDGDSPTLQCFKRWVERLRQAYEIPFNVTSTVFLLLFPEEDVARRYDMQETRLSERLAKILCIPKDKLKLWAKCSYSLGEEVWKNMELRSTSSLERSTIGLDEISMCLDELAARSKFSDASLHMRHPFPRATDDILRQIYSTLSPEDAGFLTQIILQDLRPMLYPVREDHYTSALLAMNANAIQGLTKYQAMKAWDPSGRLLELSRVHFSLRDIAEAFDHGLKPEVALRKCIPIPKSIKGTSCQDVINRFSNSDRIWVETKYDGERCQIHVEVFEGKERASHITIFSKSMRDSTLDRFDLHAHICHALDLPHVPATLEMVQSQQVVRSFILDAEMVSWCKTEERVDEFRHIAHLINRTSWGARGRDHRRILQLEGKKRKEKKERSINNDSQSDIDDDEGRQLALVFFDIMFLDGKSLMDSPYAYRRSILENTIHCIRGRVMLAKRTAIDMRASKRNLTIGRLAGRTPEEAMRTLFSELCTNYEEGDVVKADESAYNDWTCQWVKLKRDYIPGLGDSVDLVVVGAGWEKERARDLRVPVSTLTTFYLGVITNKEQMPGVRPEIYVYFTCSYGLGRKELEKINYTFKSSDSVEYGQLNKANFDYDLVFFEKLRPSPSHIFLKRPALAEVFGAMFIKSPGCPCYELRFPRITKFYRSQDRSWLEGLSKLQMNDIAYETLGRISVVRDVDDMWASYRRQEPRIIPASHERQKIWERRLAQADANVRKRTRRRRYLESIDRDSDNDSDQDTENNDPMLSASPARTGQLEGPPHTPKGMSGTYNTTSTPTSRASHAGAQRPLSDASPNVFNHYKKRGNLRSHAPDTPLSRKRRKNMDGGAVELWAATSSLTAWTPPTSPQTPSQRQGHRGSTSDKLPSQNPQSMSPSMRIQSKHAAHPKHPQLAGVVVREKIASKVGGIQTVPTSAAVPQPTAAQGDMLPEAAMDEQSSVAITPIAEFIGNSYVWYPPDGRKWFKRFKHQCHIHDATSFLLGCGWRGVNEPFLWGNMAQSDGTSRIPSQARRGVVLIASQHDAQWLTFIRRKIALHDYDHATRHPLYIFDVNILDYTGQDFLTHAMDQYL